MKKEKIIVNGKSLNFIQKLYFKADPNTLDNLKKTSFYISVIAIVYLFFVGKISIGFILSGITLLGVYMSINQLLKNPIIFSDSVDTETQDALKLEVQKYFINAEEFKIMMFRPRYSEPDIRIQMIKNSSGHKSIEYIKQRMAVDIPSMVPYAKEITEAMIESVLKEYNEKSTQIKLPQNALNIKNRSTEILKEWYKIALGIKKTDKFTQKSVDIITRERLIDFMENKFQI